MNAAFTPLATPTVAASPICYGPPAAMFLQQWPRLTFQVFGLSSLIWFSIGVQAQEPSEEVLKKVLERYPAADANKDGKLTREEARAYRLKMTGKADQESKVGTMPQPAAADQ